MIEDEGQIRQALTIAMTARPRIATFLQDMAKRNIPEAVVAKAALGDSKTVAMARHLAKSGKYEDSWQHLAILAAAGVPDYEKHAWEAFTSLRGAGYHIERSVMLPEPRRFQFLSRVLSYSQSQDSRLIRADGVFAVKAIERSQGRNAYRLLVQIMKGSRGVRCEAAEAIVNIEYRTRLEEARGQAKR